MLSTTARAFTADEINKALDKAIDDIVETAEIGPFGIREALDLLANAASYYLTSPGADLGDAIEANYSEAAENEFPEASARRSYEEEAPGPSRRSYDGERDAKLDAMANTEARQQTLTEQLLEQWSFADVDEELRGPGRLLIGYIDD